MPLAAPSQKDVEKKIHKHISALTNVCDEYSPYSCFGFPLMEFCNSIISGYSIAGAERNWKRKMEEQK